MNQPIKRHLTLQPLSRDHHQGLLLCFKIRKEIKDKAAVALISDYIRDFNRDHLLPHFEIEEIHVFPVLGNDHELIVRALAEHKGMQDMIANDLKSYEQLESFAQLLDDHIRFEERILFNEIEKMASEEQLLKIKEVHPDRKIC